MDSSPLSRRLRVVRRRWLLIGTSAALIRGLLAMFLLLVAGVWLDMVWELSPPLRIAALAVAGVGGLMLLAISIWRTLRGGREADMARRLDRAAGLGGDILTGWELSAAGTSGGSQSASAALSQPTRDMARLAAARAAALAQVVAGRQAVAARPLVRALSAFALFGVAAALVAMLAPGLARTAWLRFSQPYADVPPLARTQFKIEPGNTRVRYGDGLDIYATPSGAPVEQLELVLIPAGTDAAHADAAQTDKAHAEIVPMFAETDGRWRAALAKVTEPATYYVQAHRARSYQYHVAVVLVPEIENVRARIVPPAYTNEAPYDGPIPKDGIAGLAGTKVELRAGSNRPLSGGRIVLTPADGSAATLPMAPPAPGENEVVGRFEIRASGKLELRVTDVDGQISRDAVTTTVTRLVDAAPFVRILRPEDSALATPTANLPVEIAAEDDYGLSRVQLFRSLNESRPLPTDIRRPAIPPRRLNEKLYLPLASYGLEPGDVIRLSARAEDNDPAGAKGTESGVVSVRIISQEEFERMVRVREGLQGLLSKYNQSRRRLEKLAAELDGLRKKKAAAKDGSEKDAAAKNAAPPGKLADADRQQLMRLAREMREESKAIRQAAEHLLPYDLDAEMTAQLAEEAKALDDMAADLEELQRSSGATDKQMQELLDKLAKQLEASREKHDQEATVPLDFLAKLFPLMADAQRFAQIAEEQQDLAERLAAVKDRETVDDPLTKARLRDMETQQHRLRDDLSTVLADIENHARELPDDPRLKELREGAQEFVKAVRESGAEAAMSDAEAALTEFSGQRGHAKAKEAAEILARFTQKSDRMEEMAGGGLKSNGKLSGRLGQTIEQLLAEMGLGRGTGKANGKASGNGGGKGGTGGGTSGGGYSARRGPGIGLYGNLATLGGDAAASGSGQSQAARGEAGGGGSAAPAGAPPTLADVPATAAASGTSPAAIPPRYRQRVGQYFQRVMEDSGDSAK